MIKELKLVNWKSFAEATLFIDPLTVLIGSNAGGKSNTLDALLFLNRVSQGIAITPAIAGDVNFPAIRGGMEWICRKNENQFTLSVIVDGNHEKQDYRYELTVQVNNLKAELHLERLTLLKYDSLNKNPTEKILFQTEQEESGSLELPVYFSSGPRGRQKRNDLHRTNTVLSQIETFNLNKEVRDGVKQVLSQLKKIFVFEPIPSRMRDYTPLSQNLLPDGSNIAGVLADLKEKNSQVEETLTHYLKNLPERDINRIWTEPVGRFKTDAMLYCEEGWENQQTHEADARGMSDGTLRYLSIVTALLTREPGSLLVVEEVDNGLHPSRAKFLINMLKTLGGEQNIDVVVTTHNPALLDAAGVSMVPFIVIAHRDDTSGFSRLTQLEDIEMLPKLIACGSIGDLSRDGRIEAALKQESGK